MNEKTIRLLKVLIPVGIVVVILIVIGIFAISMHGDRTGSANEGDKVVVNITEEDTVDSLAEKLKDLKVIDFSGYFKLYCKAARGVLLNRGFRIGNVELKKNMSYDDILQAVVTPWVNERDTVTITFTEGSEVNDIVAKLISNGIGTSEGFADVIENNVFNYDFIPAIGTENRLEGYLYPDTYIFFADSTEVEALTKFLDNFKAKISDPEVAELIGESEYNLKDIVIIASIIEKESGNVQDMGKVSSVFHNRLDINMLLQSCATFNYTVPKTERSPALTAAQIASENPYNTYKYKGLPPTPIANPGIDAIRAALSPEDTDYLFFCATGDGGTAFAETIEQHNANVAKYKDNW